MRMLQEKKITSKLLAQVKKLTNVEIYEYTTMTDIIVEDGVCRGIYAKDQNGQELEIYADNTIWQAVELEEDISILPIPTSDRGCTGYF